MSAHQQATGGGYAWTDAELKRAKDLRREGYTAGTIAGFLRREFETERTGQGLQALFRTLRMRGEITETVEDHDRQEARRRAEVRERMAELKAANTVRRRCLSCERGFDSWGAGNRVCANCRASEAWR